MITKKQIAQFVTQAIEDTDIYLVDIEVKPTNKIYVELDKAPSISIDECIKVSRFIERSLDRDSEDFELNVSSPGLDKPFKIRAQYEKNQGKEVKVIQANGDSLKGVLKQVNADNILVEFKEKVKLGILRIRIQKQLHFHIF